MSASIPTFTGPGEYSVDGFLGLDWFYSPRNNWIAFGAAVAIGLGNVVARRPVAPQRS